MSKRRTHVTHLNAASVARAALLALTLCAAHALAQREAPASVAGRVREGERGVAGVTVVVVSADPSQRFKPVARARTDAEGRYRVAGIPPGRYSIAPAAPAYVLQDSGSGYPPGKPLTLSAGDSVEDADFRLVRGAVITGRVTDSDGNPVIAEPVRVTPADSSQSQQFGPAFYANQRDLSTDDRGVYRIFGLQPGRYRVSVGNEGGTFRASGGKYYRRTFYPSAVDESQAKVVELTAGGEAADVDIMLGSPERTFRASGRFVTADTNQPVQVYNFGYSMLDSSGRLTGQYGGLSSDARGEFQITGLAPGRYRVYASQNPAESAEWYSDAAPFDVSDSDVSGVVVKLRRGSTVSGVVTIEGVSDRAAVQRMLSAVRVYGFVQRGGASDPSGYIRPAPLAPDGSFSLAGVRPGKLRLGVDSNIKGLALSRVEVGGVLQRDGVDVSDGAQVSGVRIALVYGNSVLRGQLNFPDGGAAPPGARMVVILRRVNGTEDQFTKGVEADARGRFQIEGLAAGEYEVQARAFGGGVPALMSEPQRVSIGEGGDVTVSLALAPPPN